MNEHHTHLLRAMANRGLRGPAPESNWWGMAAESSRSVFIETPGGRVPGSTIRALVKEGYVTATPLPESEQMPGGDELDRTTHRYTVTPAGRAYLSSLTERTTR